MATLNGALVSLIDYDGWATHRILEAASRLKDDQLDAPAGAPERTIRQIIIHAIGTMAFWQARLRSEQPPSPNVNDRSDLASIVAFSTATREAFRELVAGLSPDDLDREFSARGTSLTWSEIFLQILEHAIHHRGEVASLLTAHGASPGDLDYLFYLRDRNAAVS